MMFRCSRCKEWGNPPSTHLHKEEEIEGILEITDINRDRETRLSEDMQLEDGLIVYRYLLWESDLFLISSSQTMASKALCLCRDCLEYSLSFIPHYGDGAYCTSNDYLKNENPRILHSHGIDIRGMNFRVVMKVRDASNFKKVKKTAGVIRSTPIGENLYVNKLVFSDKESLKIICYQQWNGHSWEDVLLDDLKGVS
ncbi:hypothetical protein ACDZ29_23340 [Peribacillus sp. RS7]|uniref:hypothetical protein n=2 Tax=Peribacillus TaxID=2675229 RepID=UPI001F4F9E16|nr:hypothetical protein [Peribacillus frigoritolerans]MCK2017960.1 hypothetical protein [Peribacillus frigoritolerans]